MEIIVPIVGGFAAGFFGFYLNVIAMLTAFLGLLGFIV